MAQQIKKKFIGNDQIDSTKLKLLQNQAVRVVDSAGEEQELIKLNSTDEVLVKGQKVGLKSEIEAEESRAMIEEASIRALITNNSVDQSQLVEQEESRALAAEASLQSQISQEVLDRQYAVSNEASLRQQADLLLQTSIQTEQSRAVSVETSLQSQLSQEILDRQSDVDAEQSARIAADQTLQSSLDSEQSSRIAGDLALSDRLDVLEADPTTKGYVDGEVSDLQSQIDNIVSNIDPATLDSLSEIVAEFQSVDSDLNAAILALGTGAQSALADEISRAQAAEQTLQLNIDAEESRAMSAEGSLQSQIDSEESRAMAVESSLQSQLTQEILDRQADVNAEESRAMSVESSLQSQISQEILDRQSAVSSEMSRAMSVESSLQSQITSEISSRQSSIASEQSRAVAAETSLSSAILTEQSRAQSAEASLQSDLDNLDGYAQDIRSDLDLEETRALAAEASLQSSITAEASSRVSAISAEQSARIASVSAEASARSLADSLLSDRVDPIEDLLDFEKLHVYENNAQVYADGKVPEADVSLRDGWYFKNTSAGQKINWYFFDGLNQANISLQDFSAYAVMTFDSVSPVRSPIIAAYTMPTGSGDIMPGFAHSKVVYSGLSSTPVAGKKYLVYFGQNPAIHPELPRLELSMSSSSSAGDRNPSERILTSSFGSNSSDLVNTTQFMVESVGVNSPSFKDEVELRIRPASLAKLQIEESARIAGDSSLQSQISTEKSRIDAILLSSSADKDSFAEIVQLINSIDMDTDTGFASAVSSLQSAINAEQTRAESVESSLQSQIDAEISRATAAEYSLDSRLDIIEPKVSTLESEMDQAQLDISSLTSNKANKSLSNLDAVTAIPASVTDLQSENTSQVFASEFKINTKNQVDSNSGSIRVISGDASGNVVSGGGRVGSGINSNASRASAITAATGLVSMVSGAISGGTQGSTGSATVSTGNVNASAVTGNTGAITVRSGNNFGVGTSGQLLVESGFSINATGGKSGAMYFGSGKSMAASSGDVLIYSGSVNNSLGLNNSTNTNPTGQITVETGVSVSSAATGALNLRSGANSGTGNSGDVSIESGSVVSGVRGKVSVSARVVEMNTVLDMQSNRIIDLADPISAQEAATKAYVDSRRPIFNKESFVVGSNSIGATHVDLAHEADAMSLVVFVGRLALHKDEDYTLSVVSGVTRITWTGSFGSGGDEEVANGDKIFVTYSR